MVPAGDLAAEDGIGLGLDGPQDLGVGGEQVPGPRHGGGGGLAAGEHQDGDLVG